MPIKLPVQARWEEESGSYAADQIRENPFLVGKEGLTPEFETRVEIAQRIGRLVDIAEQDECIRNFAAGDSQAELERYLHGLTDDSDASPDIAEALDRQKSIIISRLAYNHLAVKEVRSSDPKALLTKLFGQKASGLDPSSGIELAYEPFSCCVRLKKKIADGLQLPVKSGGMVINVRDDEKLDRRFYLVIEAEKSAGDIKQHNTKEHEKTHVYHDTIYHDPQSERRSVLHEADLVNLLADLNNVSACTAEDHQAAYKRVASDLALHAQSEAAAHLIGSLSEESNQHFVFLLSNLISELEWQWLYGTLREYELRLPEAQRPFFVDTFAPAFPDLKQAAHRHNQTLLQLKQRLAEGSIQAGKNELLAVMSSINFNEIPLLAYYMGYDSPEQSYNERDAVLDQTKGNDDVAVRAFLDKSDYRAQLRIQMRAEDGSPEIFVKLADQVATEAQLRSAASMMRESLGSYEITNFGGNEFNILAEAVAILKAKAAELQCPQIATELERTASDLQDETRKKLPLYSEERVEDVRRKMKTALRLGQRASITEDQAELITSFDNLNEFVNECCEIMRQRGEGSDKRGEYQFFSAFMMHEYLADFQTDFKETLGKIGHLLVQIGKRGKYPTLDKFAE